MKKIRITFNAPVVLSFTMLCLIATVMGIVSNGRSTELLFMTYPSSWRNPATYFRFFSHVLGHVNITHFIGNASYILLLGPMIEEKYGSKIVAEIIVITAYVTGVVNYIFFWNTGLCGASGIVFAFILVASFTSFKQGEFQLLSF